MCYRTGFLVLVLGCIPTNFQECLTSRALPLTLQRSEFGLKNSVTNTFEG